MKLVSCIMMQNDGPISFFMIIKLILTESAMRLLCYVDYTVRQFHSIFYESFTDFT